jgi:hypothetical protein
MQMITPEYVDVDTPYGEMRTGLITAYPEGKIDAPPIIMSPGLGSKMPAIALAAIEMANQSGREVTGYVQDYGHYVGNPRTNLAQHVARTALTVAKHKYGRTAIDWFGHSAGSLAPIAVFEEKPDAVNSVTILSGAALNTANAFTNKSENNVSQKLPLTKRIPFASGMPEAQKLGIQTAIRFIKNGILQAPRLALTERREFMQANRGLTTEAFQNLRLTNKRPQLLTMFAVAATLNLSPEIAAMLDSGIGVHVIHGTKDRVFPINDVEDTLKPTVDNGLDFTQIVNPTASGHHYISSRGGLMGVRLAAKHLVRQGIGRVA